MCICLTSYTQVADFESTTDGMLLPRMTTVQRDAITNLSQSLLVYDTDTKSFWYYEDMMWNELGSGGSTTALSGESGSAMPNAPIVDGDPTGAPSTITLSDPGVIGAETEIKICMNINHGFLGDVDVTLTAPDGTTVLDLSSDNGGIGFNYTNTCFTTSATNLITGGSAPFTGNWIPEQALSDLIGQSIAGDWVLTVFDDDPYVDNGTFDSWSIAFQNGEVELVNLISDIDADTRILVEQSIDEDTIRVQVIGTEVMTISDTDIESTVPITAPSFIGDGSQLTNLPGGGGCTEYGDGSAGDLTISGSVDWSTTPPTNGNYMFQNLTINSGVILTVESGTIIQVSQTFTNNGTIEVSEGIPGERWSGNTDGGFPRIKGNTLSFGKAYKSEHLRFLSSSSILIGGSPGADGGNTGLDAEGGFGGGSLTVKAITLSNAGTIRSNGGDGVVLPTGSTISGCGGGGGGFIVLQSNSISNTGTIEAMGGDGGSPGDGDDDHAGGGGGGGLVHLIAPNANAVAGSIIINGGAAGTQSSSNLGSSGGSGGAGAGDGGLGGADDTNPAAFFSPEAGGVGVLLRTQVTDPCSFSN